MDLRQLAALVAVVDHGSFSAAAKALHTVQSNISAHVAHLERELGVTLLDRAGARLTPAGEVVVERARRVEAELSAMSSDVASMGAEVAGAVRLGVIGSTARWLVPGLLDAARSAHPRVQVVVVEAGTTSLLPQLVSGRLDGAILNLPVNDRDLSAETLFEEDMVAVAPIGHPLAQRDEVSVADLSAYPLLLGPRGTALRDDLEAEAARVGVELTPRAELDGVRLMATLAFDGFAPAVLPATAVPVGLSGEWRRLRVTGLPRRQVGLAVRHRGLPSTSARALLEVVRRVVAGAIDAGNGTFPPHV